MEIHQQAMWVWDSENNRMVNREIKYVPGFFKIIDEILVNAADNKVCVYHMYNGYRQPAAMEREADNHLLPAVKI